jgi:hypothetical protein
MVDEGTVYWVYWRGRQAYAASRESRRRCRTACHEAESLRLQLVTLRDEVNDEVSRARRRHLRPEDQHPLTPR